MKKILSLTALLLSNIAMSSCSGLFPGVYRIDIPQGNLVTQEKVDEVKLGMNRRQVRFILGSPLITDSFNQDRWDYFYSVNSDSKTTIEHHTIITFNDNKVIDIKDALK